jgi:hypothetical protein
VLYTKISPVSSIQPMLHTQFSPVSIIPPVLHTQYSPVSIIPPMLHTDLVNTTHMRRRNGWILGTFNTAVLFGMFGGGGDF